MWSKHCYANAIQYTANVSIVARILMLSISKYLIFLWFSPLHRKRSKFMTPKWVSQTERQMFRLKFRCKVILPLKRIVWKGFQSFVWSFWNGNVIIIDIKKNCQYCVVRALEMNMRVRTINWHDEKRRELCVSIKERHAVNIFMLLETLLVRLNNSCYSRFAATFSKSIIHPIPQIHRFAQDLSLG